MSIQQGGMGIREDGGPFPPTRRIQWETIQLVDDEIQVKFRDGTYTTFGRAYPVRLRSGGMWRVAMAWRILRHGTL